MLILPTITCSSSINTLVYPLVSLGCWVKKGVWHFPLSLIGFTYRAVETEQNDVNFRYRWLFYICPLWNVLFKVLFI